MKTLRVLWMSVAACFLAGIPVASAESVTEVWRSSFGTPYSVSVNPNDGSVWAATGASVMHVAADGAVLSQTDGFSLRTAVCVNPTDGSCWVADPERRQVARISASGDELLRDTGMGGVSVSVNTADGSCWVADQDGPRLLHVAANGSLLGEPGVFSGPRSVSVNSGDGSCWVGDLGGQVVHLSASGQELWRGTDFGSPYDAPVVSVNPTNGSCWVASSGNSPGAVRHLSASGDELWRNTGVPLVLRPSSLSVNPVDGSCWMADAQTNQVVHFAEDGTELWRSPADPLETFDTPGSVSVNPVGGSCWVADTGHSQLVHVSADGSELWRGGGFIAPASVAVNPVDGSCWVADTGNDQVVHLSAEGAELWRGSNFAGPQSVSVYPGDGSCWVADTGHDQVVHLSASGEELWRWGGFSTPVSVSVDTADGSCWVGDAGKCDPHFPFDPVGADIVHLSASGVQLLRVDSSLEIYRVAASASDGSCWVTCYGWFPHRVGPDGLLLAEVIGVEATKGIAVDESNGSCWVSEIVGHLVHVNHDGHSLSATSGFGGESVSVNSTDGSCWATAGSAVVHVAESGEELWRSGAWVGWPGFGELSAVAVNTADGSCWMADAGGSQVVHLQLAVTADFTATPVTGLAPLLVTFTDLSTGSRAEWAWTFGDGTTSTDQHPSHTYTAAGSYTVSLMVTNAWGFDTETKTGYIVVSAPVPPAAAFSATPTIGYAPLVVTFADASTGDVDSWLWDFGDGTTATNQNPSHSFTAVGTYLVSLTVTGPGGADSEERPHYIAVTFPDVPFEPDEYWALHQILACVDADIVQGYPSGLYQPTTEVSREQMAVYISRALAGGDESVQVPSGVVTPTFPDVGTDHWAYRYIEYCAAAGIVQGYPGGGYHPSEAVNRGQMAVYVGRSVATPTGDAGVPEVPAGATPTFFDVNAENEWAWCYKHVEYCAAADVVQGYWDGTYRPDLTVTRDQMAVYVARAFELAL